MKLTRITTLTLLVCAALLPASGVQAGISAPGTSCVAAHPVLDANEFYYRQNVMRRATYAPAWVSCPIPAEKSIGATAEFDIQVDADYDEDRFRCVGAVFDAEGDLVATTPTVTSTGSRGRRRLSTAVEVGSTASTSYLVACHLTGHLVAVRAY